jgi:hypothetical protein
MERSGMLKPTCREIVPRDRTSFETSTTNLHYTPQLHKLFVAGSISIRLFESQTSLQLHMSHQ